MDRKLPPRASANYVDHPQGYACKECGAAAKIGSGVRHAKWCDVPDYAGQTVLPAWPTHAEQIEVDTMLAAGHPDAETLALRLAGLEPRHFGSWTRWRKTGEWAARVDGAALVGDTIEVVANSGRREKGVVTSRLWSDGRSSIVSVEVDRQERDVDLARVGDAVRRGDAAVDYTDDQIAHAVAAGHCSVGDAMNQDY